MQGIKRKNIFKKVYKKIKEMVIMLFFVDFLSGGYQQVTQLGIEIKGVQSHFFGAGNLGYSRTCPSNPQPLIEEDEGAVIDFS